jgi:hypothetical protein
MGVMAMVSVVFVIVSMLFHRMFQSDRIAAQAAVQQFAIGQLSNTFRRDVHAAQGAQIDIVEATQLPSLRLTRADAAYQVVYLCEAKAIHRLMVENDRTLSRESFRLPGSHAAISGQRDDAQATVVTLLLERPSIAVTASPQAAPQARVLSIDAELDRDRRLASGLVSTAANGTSGGSR